MPLIEKNLHSDFSPSVLNPFFFIRKGLKAGVEKYASNLTGKMMDFGCGTKPYRSLFQVEEYIGVDFENPGHPHDNERIDIFYDGLTIPLPDGYFDSVLSSEVFEHIFNLDHVLRELNRVMKPGGKLLVTCPFVWNEHEVPYDYARYTRFALADILKRNGFEIMEFSKTGNFVTATYQLWILYWYHLLYPRTKKIAILRWIYKIFFVFFPNLLGIFSNIILPKQYSFYLNNVVLAQKSSVVNK